MVLCPAQCEFVESLVKWCTILCIVQLSAFTNAASVEPRLAAPVDVRLVLDISGSMGANDPNNRRADALSMFIRLLPENGHAGIWTFGALVNQLVRHGPSGQLWQQVALARTANLPTHALRSNLPEALRQASWDWQQAPSNGPRHIVLLSDGIVDVGDDGLANAAAMDVLLRELVPRLVDADIRLHALTMAQAPGAELLNQLAQATGGYALDGVTPESMLAGFAAALDTVASVPQVALSAAQPQAPATASAPASTHRPNHLGPSAESMPVEPQRPPAVVLREEANVRSFQVDSGVSAIDVLWLADPKRRLTLVAPNGQTYNRQQLPPRAAWHLGGGYELASLSLPMPGLWEMRSTRGVSSRPSEDPIRTRVLVYADLAIGLLDARGALSPQALQSVDAQLVQGDGSPILDPDMLALVEMRASLQSQAGSRPVVVEPGEVAGQYRATLPYLGQLDAGTLQFEAVGPTFTRAIRMPFQVRPPVQLELQSQPQGLLGWVRVGLPGLAPDSLVIAAKVRQAPAPAVWVSAIQQPGGIWKILLDAAPGKFEIELDIQGKYLSGKQYSFRGETISVTVPLASSQVFKLAASGKQFVEPPAAPEPARVGGAPAAATSSPTAEPKLPVTVPAPGVQATATLTEPKAEPMLGEAQQAELPAAPPETRLPLWFVALVGLLNLGVCVGLGWLLKPATATASLLEKLQQAVDNSQEAPAPA